MSDRQTDGLCCDWTGVADHAAVPCPNPHCPVPTEAQILAYHAAEIEPRLFLGVTDDVQAWYRRQYVQGVRNNPEAMRQLAAWRDAQGTR